MYNVFIKYHTYYSINFSVSKSPKFSAHVPKLHYCKLLNASKATKALLV